jgi:hypothetical protein
MNPLPTYAGTMAKLFAVADELDRLTGLEVNAQCLVAAADRYKAGASSSYLIEAEAETAGNLLGLIARRRTTLGKTAADLIAAMPPAVDFRIPLASGGFSLLTGSSPRPRYVSDFERSPYYPAHLGMYLIGYLEG